MRLMTYGKHDIGQAGLRSSPLSFVAEVQNTWISASTPSIHYHVIMIWQRDNLHSLILPSNCLASERFIFSKCIHTRKCTVYCAVLFLHQCLSKTLVEGGMKVHSTLGPLNGLLCQPRVIMIMEKSVEWLAGETEVLGENLPQFRFVHHKPHMMPVREPGPPRWEASV
jgi:hypothetical protein